MTDAAARRWERQMIAIAGGCAVLGALCLTVFPVALGAAPEPLDTELVTGALAAAAFSAGLLSCATAWVHHRWFFSTRQRLRRDLGDVDGWLDVHDMRDVAGDDAVRAEAARFWGHPVEHLTVEQAGWTIGEPISGRWTVRGQLVRAPWPRSVIVIGPQGSGKSQFLEPLILDSPTATIITSTKPELVEDTAAHRERTHGPTYVYDPLGLTSYGNSFPYDPVSGCADPRRADRTAAAMVRGASLHAQLRETFWSDVGREILRCYLMAADLANLGSEALVIWAHNPDDPKPIELLESNVHEGSAVVPEVWITNLRARLGTNQRQREGYLGTVQGCVDYMANAKVRSALSGHPNGRFDMRAFLDNRCTLYIIGDGEERGLSALMTALTENLVADARAVASTAPGGHLPEPLNVVLDEVANLTPVPLARWATESRGWGITVIPVVQSRAQLDDTWGHEAGKIIWDSMITKVVLPGLSDVATLEDLSTLAGLRRVRQSTATPRRGGEESRTGLERVMPAPVIRALPPFHAFVVGLARRPVVVGFEPGFERLARERDGGPRRASWPRWWRTPYRAVRSALELDQR